MKEQTKAEADKAEAARITRADADRKALTEAQEARHAQSVKDNEKK